VTYLWVKWLHILASTLVFGGGMLIAWFMWRAHRRGDVAVIASTARSVVVADACFTLPAVALQLGTGVWLVHMLGLPFTQGWIGAALLLFVLVGACWLPVLWLQLRARDLAEYAMARGDPLPPAYHRVMRWWFALGWPAFAMVLAIFWLMVAKPA
jgi:uncharacterized membrane protein